MPIYQEVILGGGNFLKRVLSVFEFEHLWAVAVVAVAVAVVTVVSEAQTAASTTVVDHKNRIGVDARVSPFYWNKKKIHVYIEYDLYVNR